MTDLPIRRWIEFSPDEAAKLTAGKDGVTAPLNENGDPCPWPWEIQTYMIQREMKCRFCGAKVIASLPHIDYGETDGWLEPESQDIVFGKDGIPSKCRCTWFHAKTWPLMARVRDNALCAYHHPMQPQTATAAEGLD